MHIGTASENVFRHGSLSRKPNAETKNTADTNIEMVIGAK